MGENRRMRLTPLRRLVLGALVVIAMGATACSGSADTDSSSGTSTTGISPNDATTERDHGPPERSVVFESGLDGIDTYRIPSAAVTTEGTVVIVAEARSRSPLDTDPHHLVAKRSTDGGRTWGDLIEVAPQDTPEAGCYPSDPVLIAPTAGKAAGDLVVVFHPCRDRGGLYLSRSTDDGRTWSKMEPLELAEVDALPASEVDRLRSGPGHGIELSGGPAEGRLVMAADTGLASSPATVALLLSDDGGQSWRIGAHASTTEPTLDPDETAVVELADGTLLVSSRNAGAAKDERVQMRVSADGEEVLPGPGGAALTATEGLGVPGVQGSLLSLADRGKVVMSSPSDPTTRRGLRLWTGTDGTAWKPGPVPVPGPAAYSDLVRLDDDTIGVVAEVGPRHPYERIDFIPVPISSLDTFEELPADDVDPADAAAGRLMVDGRRYPVTRFCLIGDTIGLDGGRIALDTSKGLGSIGVRVDLDASEGRGAQVLSGVVPLDLTSGVTFQGTLADADGAPHDVDLVMVNVEPCG